MPITTGRFYEDKQGRLRDVGYFLYLEGLQRPFFDEPEGG